MASTVRMLRGEWTYREAVDLFRAAWMREELREAGNNQCAAAELMGMHRNTLQRTLDRLGVPHGRTNVVKRIHRTREQRKGPSCAN